MSRKAQLAKGDRVTFDCHILGTVEGQIEELTHDITNGQPYAVVKLEKEFAGQSCKEPVVNLRKAA